jgi:hypothetical protein
VWSRLLIEPCALRVSLSDMTVTDLSRSRWADHAEPLVDHPRFVRGGAVVFGAGTAFASPDHEQGKVVTKITKLEDLRGLPCGEGTQFGQGYTDFRIFRPENASVIQWACVTGETQNFPDQADIPTEDLPIGEFPGNPVIPLPELPGLSQ